MAACLITISGTSGLIQINYTISSTPYTIETAAPGSFYIEDTAVDVTYTTVTGDLTATSGCLSITNLPANCYNVFWKGISTDNYKIVEIILGSEVITIPDTNFPLSNKDFIANVNDLDNNKVKVVGYKSVFAPPSIQNIEYYYILKILGPDEPVLKIRNADDTGYIYVYGTSTSCTIPVDYESIVPCYSSTITTTTTTSAP
jgi:hypothetical protein